MDDFHVSLRNAIDSDRTDILKIILEEAQSKGLVEHVNDVYSGKTLLHYANEHSNADSVRALLVSFNADPSVKNDKGVTCYLASVNNNKIADVYHSYFLQVVTNDKLEQIEKCIAGGLDPNQEYPMEGAFILHWACQYSDSDTIQCLLRHGANPHAYDADGLTALHVAVKYANESAISVLTESEVCDVSIKAAAGDYVGFTSYELSQRFCPQFSHYFDNNEQLMNGIGHKEIDDVVENDQQNHSGGIVTKSEDLSFKGTLSVISPDRSSPVQNGGDFFLEETPKQLGHNGAPWGGLNSSKFVTDLAVCPVPKAVNVVPGCDPFNFPAGSEVLVYPQNFECWQKILDLISMIMSSLGRIGCKFNMSVVSPGMQAQKQEKTGSVKFRYPLHIMLLNQSCSIKACGSYVLNMQSKQCSVKAGTVEGIRNGLVTFLQMIIGRENIHPVVIYDEAVFQNRSVLFDFNEILNWKVGILYEVALLASVLKFNQIVLPLTSSSFVVQNMKGSPVFTLQKVCEKLVDVVVLMERFCLQTLPFLEVSSVELDTDQEPTSEIDVLKHLLKCFNDKSRVIFGSNLSMVVAQRPGLLQLVMYNLGLDPAKTDLVVCLNSPSAVNLIGSCVGHVTICTDRSDVIKEVLNCGLRLVLKSSSDQSSLFGRVDLPQTLTSITNNSACEGVFTECSFGTEAVPLFVTCLPQLVTSSDYAWNSYSSPCSSSSNQINATSPHFLHTITDKLLFNQAPGFGNALGLLSHVEKSLMPPVMAGSNRSGGANSQLSPNLLYPNTVKVSGSTSDSGLSQILRAVMEPGLISVDHCDPYLISQAEKDLRTIFAFIETYLEDASKSPAGMTVSPNSQKPQLAFQSQAYLFQLRASANVTLFTVKLIKSLFFAGKNPSKSAVISSNGQPLSPVSPDLRSVNLGLTSLSLQVKSDLANRLIVVMNDLKLIAQQELDDEMFKVYSQKVLADILAQFLPTASSM